MAELDSTDYDVIIEALSFSLERVENYRDYPSAEFRQSQRGRIADTLAKVRSMRADAAS